MDFIDWNLEIRRGINQETCIGYFMPGCYEHRLSEVNEDSLYITLLITHILTISVRFQPVVDKLPLQFP